MPPNIIDVGVTLAFAGNTLTWKFAYIITDIEKEKHHVVLKMNNRKKKTIIHVSSFVLTKMLIAFKMLVFFATVYSNDDTIMTLYISRQFLLPNQCFVFQNDD